MINYRHFQPGDEKDIVKLWNESLDYDPITLERFRNLIILDANFDPEGLRVAYKNEELVGCVYAVRRLLPMYGVDLEEENGWITFFFVSEGHRKLGVASKLLEDAEGFLKKNGRENVFFSSYAPNYIVPGIDKNIYPDGYRFLESKGFKKLYSPIAMDRNLVDFKLNSEIKELKKVREEEGYIFKHASEDDIYYIIKFANEVFNPDWGRAIREGIIQGMPIDNVLVAKENGEIVGFCVYGGYEGVQDRFGPFGVDPNQQGKGLGKILLNLCLYHMKSKGLHGSWFLWTGEETSAGYLYKKTGFTITRTFHVMKKEL